MPRQKSLVTVIRDMVGQEVHAAIQSLLGGISTGTAKPTNGRDVVVARRAGSGAQVVPVVRRGLLPRG